MTGKLWPYIVRVPYAYIDKDSYPGSLEHVFDMFIMLRQFGK